MSNNTTDGKKYRTMTLKEETAQKLDEISDILQEPKTTVMDRIVTKEKNEIDLMKLELSRIRNYPEEYDAVPSLHEGDTDE